MADRTAASGDDRISALPLDLRLRLLSLLPVDEAVRSSELSREWRGLWKKMPSLRLVDLERIETAEGFNKFVNHLIVLRGHLPLDKFKINVRASESETAEPYPYANLWIQYALICKVRVLGVSCEADVDDCIQLTVPLVSERLTTLNLCDVDFVKCSALVGSKLSLDFSSCPSLKSLTMDQCNICVHKISSKSLKRLITTFSSFNSHSRTWISTPSLISLGLIDLLGETPVLESMPSLLKAFIRLNGDQGSCDVMNTGVQKCGDQRCECCYGYTVGGYQCVLLNGLSNATHLELLADLNVYVYRRDLACCPTFGNLKTLLLNDWCVANGLHQLVCILQHSPILEKLTLLLYSTKGLPSTIGNDGNHDPIDQTFACAHLKVVNIKCQVMNEKVFKPLKLLSTCGIPGEHITLKVNQSRQYCFSFEMPQDTTPSTSDDDAAPSSTHGDATPSTSDDDDAPSSTDDDDAPSSTDDN